MGFMGKVGASDSTRRLRDDFVGNVMKRMPAFFVWLSDVDNIAVSPK